MHDPMVMAFEVHRPWPELRRNGGRLYWPALVRVWHVEPNGEDALEGACRGTRWQLHVHHWRLQFPPLQHLRRRVLTRCAECGGRSTKTHPVNISRQWDHERGPWWRGEEGLYHSECSAIVGKRNRERYEREHPGSISSNGGV